MVDASTEVPDSPRAWQEQVNFLGLSSQTIHNMPLKSASHIPREQFLMLQVLWKSHTSSAFLDYYDLNHLLPRANAILKHVSSWDKYCKTFDPRSPIPEGTFAAARYYQFQPPIRQPDFNPATPSRKPNQTFETPHVVNDAGRSPSALSSFSPPSHWSTISPDDEFMYPPTKDEQIVNTALLVYLNSLTLHFNLPVSWSLHQMALTAEFTNTKFEARTDGYLADSSGDIKAIVEVKPMLRQTKEPQIGIQESHQMVAGLLMDYKSSLPARRNKPRIIISQDRQEIYISVAKYDDNYIAYLQTRNNQSNPFMTMHQFGPWNTHSAAAMRELGPILLAISLRAREY
ncbi:hypothetical protein AKAW_06162 [Aspergillus luchuensis IFO 4308]|nr:hypothetical protein AKAW_06162 [Aspergillus luchuensis IFO 4308]